MTTIPKKPTTTVPWKDIQILNDMDGFKTATIDNFGLIQIHGKYSDLYDPQESAQFDTLVQRQRPRLATRGKPQEMSRNVQVYTPHEAHLLIKEPPCFGPLNVGFPEMWGTITAQPGTLFACGRNTWGDLYGGLTEKGVEFVLVPQAMVDMRYQEIMIFLAVERLGRWDSADVHRIAQMIEAEELSNTKNRPSEMIVRATSAAHQVSYWRSLAG